MGDDYCKKQSRKSLLQRPRGRAVLIAFLFLAVSAAIKRSFSKLDFAIFGAFTVALSLFDTAKEGVKIYVNKFKLLREGVLKHSIRGRGERGRGLNLFTVLNDISSGSGQNENMLADRVTLLGVAINILLSGAKFIGGIGSI